MRKLAPVLLICVGCRSANSVWDVGFEHAFECASQYGTVAGSDESLCRQLATMLDEVVPRVDAVGFFEPRPVQVQMLEEWPWEGSAGVSTRGEFILVPDGSLPKVSVLAHEVTHCFMFGTSWELFGQIVEEGVCDAVAMSVDSIQGAESRYACVFALGACILNRDLLVDATKVSAPGEAPWSFELAAMRTAALPRFPRLVPAVLMENDEYQRFAAFPKSALTGLGQLVVERIGLPSLLELCSSAQERGLRRVPVRELVDAAKLPNNYGTAWADILAEGLSGDVLFPMIARASAEDLAPGELEIEVSWN